MVELKGRQQWETEGKLQLHSRVIVMAQVLGPRRVHFCLPFASGAPGLEIKILQYSIEYCTVNTLNHSHLETVHFCDNVCKTQELTYVAGHGNACSNL